MNDSILALDPGTTKTGYVVYHPKSKRYIAYGKEPNEWICQTLIPLYSHEDNLLVVEKMAYQRRPVGDETFEACEWGGQFIRAWIDAGGARYMKIKRPDVKKHICGSRGAKDGDVLAMVIQICGPQGTKKDPGPTYGLAKDMWQAAALALTAEDFQRVQQLRGK